MTGMQQMEMWAPTQAAYVRPTMTEINAIPLTGLRAAGSFSGCGGSSLGLRMAGFHVAAAMEFIDVAADTYEANLSGRVIRQDIRQVKAEDVLEIVGCDVGELDLFEGSPPCASFSGAASRAGGRTRARACKDCRGTGQVATLDSVRACNTCNGKGMCEAEAKVYGAHGQKRKQRTDDLFWEWARLIEGLMPRAIVAENVPAMLNGPSLQEYAWRITQDLAELGYRTAAVVLNAASYGVPQERKRLIITGLRNDVSARPLEYPRPTVSHPFTLQQALESVDPDDPDHAPFLADSSMEGYRLGATWHRMRERRAEMAQHGTLSGKGVIDARDFAPDCERCGQPLEKHNVLQRYDGAPTKALCADGERALIIKAYFTMVLPYLDQACPTLSATGAGPGAASCVHPTECRKFTPAEAKAICGFPADFVLLGSRAERYERMGRAVCPPVYREVGRALAEALS